MLSSSQGCALFHMRVRCASALCCANATGSMHPFWQVREHEDTHACVCTLTRIQDTHVPWHAPCPFSAFLRPAPPHPPQHPPWKARPLYPCAAGMGGESVLVHPVSQVPSYLPCSPSCVVPKLNSLTFASAARQREQREGCASRAMPF